MNSQAPSVMAWRLYRSAISARLVYFREIGRTAFWEFCNTIGTKRTCWLVPRRSAFEGIVSQKSFGGMDLKFSEAWARRLNNDVGALHAKLTGDSGSGFAALSSGDCRLFRSLAVRPAHRVVAKNRFARLDTIRRRHPETGRGLTGGGEAPGSARPQPIGTPRLFEPKKAVAALNAQGSPWVR